MHPIKHHLWQIKACLFSKTKVKLNVEDVAVQGRCKRLHMPKESNFLWSWCWYSYLIPDHMQSKATGHSITVTASYSTMPLLLPYLHTTMRHKAQMGTSIVTWHRTSFFKKMFTVDECWKWMKRLQNQKYTTLPLSLTDTCICALVPSSIYLTITTSNFECSKLKMFNFYSWLLLHFTLHPNKSKFKSKWTWAWRKICDDKFV